MLNKTASRLYHFSYSETLLCLLFVRVTGAEWASKADTVTSAFVTQDAFTGRASSHGNATARRDGVAFSATRVRTEKEKEMYVDRKSRRKRHVYNTYRF